MSLEWSQFMVRLSCAFGLGCIIGLERQMRQRIAGLRTNTLVSVGACLFVINGLLMPHGSDQSRVAAQIVSGIGFLGGGVILRDGVGIRGLNTAATLWCSAAVGTLCGVGQLFFATGGTFAILCANVLLRPLALRIYRSPTTINSHDTETTYQLVTVCLASDQQHIRALLLQMISSEGVTLLSLSSKDLEDASKLEVKAKLLGRGGSQLSCERILSRLSLEVGISTVSWEVVSREHLV